MTSLSYVVEGRREQWLQGIAVKLRKLGGRECFRGIVSQTKAFATFGPGAEPCAKDSGCRTAVIEVRVNGFHGPKEGFDGPDIQGIDLVSQSPANLQSHNAIEPACVWLWELEQ